MSENNADRLTDYLLSASALPLPRAREAEAAVREILASLNDPVRKQEWLSNPRCCIGVWRGDVEGILLAILDVAVLVCHEDVARRFGREGNQIAILSLQEGREITTAGTGESTNARLQRLEQEDRITSDSGADHE